MPATGTPATRTHRVSVREMIFSLVSPTTRCVMVSFFLFFFIASLSGLDISLLLVELVIICILLRF